MPTSSVACTRPAPPVDRLTKPKNLFETRSTEFLLYSQPFVFTWHLLGVFPESRLHQRPGRSRTRLTKTKPANVKSSGPKAYFLPAPEPVHSRARLATNNNKKPSRPSSLRGEKKSLKSQPLRTNAQKFPSKFFPKFSPTAL
jgi:hypothetical protein